MSIHIENNIPRNQGMPDDAHNGNEVLLGQMLDGHDEVAHHEEVKLEPTDELMGSTELDHAKIKSDRGHRAAIALGTTVALLVGGGVTVFAAERGSQTINGHGAKGNVTKTRKTATGPVIPSQLSPTSIGGLTGSSGPAIPLSPRISKSTETSGSSSPTQSNSPNASNGPAIPVLPSASNTSGNNAGDSNSAYPNTLSGAAVKPGNLNLYTPAPKELSTTIKWNGQDWSVPDLIAPGTTELGHAYTVDDLGNQILSNWAVLMSLNQTDPTFNKVLNSFTDNNNVKEYVRQHNSIVQDERPNDGPGNNQFIIYDVDDTASSEGTSVTFDGGIDSTGHTVADGDIFVRLLGKNSSRLQGDPRSYVPSESQTMTNFRFITMAVSGTPYVKVSDIGLDISR